MIIIIVIREYVRWVMVFPRFWLFFCHSRNSVIVWVEQTREPQKWWIHSPRCNRQLCVLDHHRHWTVFICCRLKSWYMNNNFATVCSPQRSYRCIIKQSCLVHFPRGGVNGSTRALHWRHFLNGPGLSSTSPLITLNKYLHILTGLSHKLKHC